MVSDDEVKRGVKFRHSTCNASRIRRKLLLETECLNTRFRVFSAYPTMCEVQRKVKKIFV